MIHGGKCFVAACMIMLTQAGCATLDEEECATVNWYDLGLTDGAKGRNIARTDSYRKDCAEFGLHVDSERYRAGWDQGIQRFCTRENGYEVGIRGQNYAKSCPPGLSETFYPPYQLGRAVHDLNAKVDGLRAEIEGVSDVLAEADLDKDERRSLRGKRRRLEKELEREEWALSDASEDARQQGFYAPY